MNIALERIARRAAAAILALVTLVPASAVPTSAGTQDRTLELYFGHTGERLTVTYKHNGQFVPEALAKLNHFLRDWRADKQTRMDPHLFDLVWEVYQETHATGPIYVVSAYRSPQSNEYLRSRSANTGVAKNSNHMRGLAMDFYIPGVPLATLRAAAMKLQVGGVGYYPTSGSPFVHLDTGTVRAWPRMTTAQLKKLFPDGKTLHLPTNGVPLSASGRKYAMAQWQQCHQVPCNGARPSVVPDVMVASNSPSERVVTSVAVEPPVPFERPAIEDQPTTVLASLETAPTPAQRPQALALANVPLPEPAPSSPGEMALAALDAAVPATRPVNAGLPANSILVAGYAPEIKPDPGAQRALQILLERQTTGGTSPLNTASSVEGTPPEARPVEVRTASLSPGGFSLANLSDMVNRTLSGFVGTDRSPLASLETRPGELVAPDIDHVQDLFVEPVRLTTADYDALFEPDTADLDPATELGPYGNLIVFEHGATVGLASAHFVVAAPITIASR
ncbi:MAG TPA: DUF882 domain-containing protein [Devosiaceae bacterium]